jgi:hypothetical protein
MGAARNRESSGHYLFGKPVAAAPKAAPPHASKPAPTTAQVIRRAAVPYERVALTAINTLEHEGSDPFTSACENYLGKLMALKRLTPEERDVGQRYLLRRCVVYSRDEKRIIAAAEKLTARTARQ